MWRAGLLVCAFGITFPLNGAARSAQTGPIDPTVHQPKAKADSGPMTRDDKLRIVRYIDGEFAKVVQPLPSIKPGFRLKPGKKIDQQELQAALIRSMPAANPGDTVQITNIKFERKKILFDINGGSSPHESWRQRIHISFGGTMPSTRVMQNQPPGLEKMGSTLILEFERPVPNLTPAQVKKYLSPFLNFAGERSAATNWVETLAPKFRKAIQEHIAIVGMNRTMVLAALGRADHKVREFKPDGTETEDWIYGRPPGTTIFVTFIGDSVVRVKRFP
jgi:hypothetical protein